MKQVIFLFASIALSLSVYAQSGCTDPNANNYDDNAQVNDGSCLYEPMVIDPEIIVDELPSAVEETSGLIFFRNALWTHNDSGGQAAIYKLDPETGVITQTIHIANGQNFDIEDITQDDEFIYVGDFGNNYGTRDDLVIYKLQKIDIPDTGNIAIDAELIQFSYNDQKSFEKRNRNNDFDCESIASLGDHLYLFTKNWVNRETKCYKISKAPGNYPLDIYDSFNVEGLITSADYNAEKEALVLLGYENFVPFLWVIWDFNEDHFFNGHKKRVDFAYLSGAQTEGVCFVDSDQIMISSENSYYPPRLYKMFAEQVIAATNSSEKYQPFEITIFPNPADQEVQVSVKGLKKPNFDLEIYNLSWQKVSQFSFIEENPSAIQVKVSTQNLGTGIFFVKIRQGKNIGFQKFYIK